MVREAIEKFFLYVSVTDKQNRGALMEELQVSRIQVSNTGVISRVKFYLYLSFQTLEDLTYILLHEEFHLLGSSS